MRLPGPATDKNFEDIRSLSVYDGRSDGIRRISHLIYPWIFAGGKLHFISSLRMMEFEVRYPGGVMLTFDGDDSTFTLSKRKNYSSSSMNSGRMSYSPVQESITRYSSSFARRGDVFFDFEEEYMPSFLILLHLCGCTHFDLPAHDLAIAIDEYSSFLEENAFSRTTGR